MANVTEKLNPEQVPKTVENVMNEATHVANVSSVFGEPYNVGEKTIIPVARIRHAMGFGTGGGFDKEQSFGSGGGGGSYAGARPVAVIEIEGKKVRIKLVTDNMPIALAGIALAGWNVFWIARTIRAFRRK